MNNKHNVIIILIPTTYCYSIVYGISIINTIFYNHLQAFKRKRKNNTIVVENMRHIAVKIETINRKCKYVYSKKNRVYNNIVSQFSLLTCFK